MGKRSEGREEKLGREVREEKWGREVRVLILVNVCVSNASDIKNSVSGRGSGTKRLHFAMCAFLNREGSVG